MGNGDIIDTLMSVNNCEIVKVARIVIQIYQGNSY